MKTKKDVKAKKDLKEDFIGFYLNKSLAKRTRDHAAKEDMPVSMLIRRAIIAYLPPDSQEGKA